MSLSGVVAFIEIDIDLHILLIWFTKKNNKEKCEKSKSEKKHVETSTALHNNLSSSYFQFRNAQQKHLQFFINKPLSYNVQYYIILRAHHVSLCGFFLVDVHVVLSNVVAISRWMWIVSDAFSNMKQCEQDIEMLITCFSG